jgi:hypothetical protein
MGLLRLAKLYKKEINLKLADYIKSPTMKKYFRYPFLLISPIKYKGITLNNK